MAWSQATITSVAPPIQYGTSLLLSWTSTSPFGTNYQVYVDRKLMWYGHGLSTAVPIPPNGVSRIDIGTVGVGESQIDFSADLTPAPQRFAELSWLGGTFESAAIAGFNIYSSVTAGGGVNYTAAVGTVTAYTAGIVTDGFGYGGFGEGGFGESAGAYGWTSGTLTDGAWTFGVVPFDTAGNLGPTTEVVIDIMAPPFEPPFFSDGTGTRLHYTYNPSNFEATLTWLASSQ
jgi:hypothetical protein